MLPWTWQEVKSEAVSVDEADYSCWNLLAAGPRGIWRGRGVGVVLMMCCPLILEMRLAVVWMVFYSCLFKHVCSVAMWVLCVTCGMGCGLLVAMTENW